jgi:hypothetical protein
VIILFSILNEKYSEIFQKYFIEKSFFSEVQINMIMDSTPILLNIVKMSSKNETSNYLTKFLLLLIFGFIL